MADRQLDNLEQGLELAGIALEGKTKEINQRVNAEAEKRHKSRLMSELNKSLATRGKTEYNNGYRQGKRDYCIWYTCSVCGKLLEIKANGKEVKGIRENLYRQGWGHQSCHK
jgi:hypothetical protein